MLGGATRDAVKGPLPGTEVTATLSALPLAAAYAVEGGTLTLLTAAGTIVATYLRVR